MSNLTINMKDFTASGEGRNELFFLTNKFKDGALLGFWTHSPWGHCVDQDRGWVVISPEGEILDSKQTFDFGPIDNFGTETFRQWRSRQKAEHGPAEKLLNDFDEQEWKMTECL